MLDRPRDSALEVRKTYKLYVGGEFIRTESGRYDPVESPKKEFLANVSRGSRKDLRDAVRKARAAQPGWAGKTAYLKGQILYRMAEMLEGRGDSFAKILRDTRGLSAAAAKAEVRASIDRLVHYAGWSDKFGAILGTSRILPRFSFPATPRSRSSRRDIPSRPSSSPKSSRPRTCPPASRT